MKRSSSTPSATSLPRAPRDEVAGRSIRYLVTMGIRIACFVLMVVVQPYGWYTWIFGAGAIFLPYIAVVIANVGQDARTPRAENPERALPAAAAAPVSPATPETEHPVLRITETPPAEQPESPDEAAK